MELILSLAALFAFGIVINLISAGMSAGGRAVKKAVTGKETYFGPAQIKFIDEAHDKTGWTLKKLMFRGRMPNTRGMEVGFAISAFDITDDSENPKPVFSIVEQAQEPETICFQVSRNFGWVGEGSSLTDWVELGVLVPDLMQPAFSGQRQIQVVLRMYNTKNPPSIRAGFSGDDGELILFKSQQFSFNFEDKGYEEESRDREEAQSLSLKIGVAIAMSDGNLEPVEGEVLKSWIVKEIAGYSDDKMEALKQLYNTSLKEGYQDAKYGKLSLSELTDRLNEIGDKKSKYEAIELCLDVMAADGVADPEEMAVIRNVAESLDLDMDEIEAMRDKITLDLTAGLASGDNVEALVGIDESWSTEQKRKHLRAEFQKWSNRLNSLDDPDEKASAQSMLDNIASLRRRYE